MKSVIGTASLLALALFRRASSTDFEPDFLPLEQTYGSNHQHPVQQAVTQDHEVHNTKSTYRLALKSIEMAMVTNMALGSPPQPFHVAVDLGRATSIGLSADCTDWTCDPDYHWLYNPNKSSSFVPIGTTRTIQYNDGQYYGHLSQDTLHLLGLQVENQTFHEATSLLATGFDYLWDYYDGLLGLSPPTSDSRNAVNSVLTNMLSQDALSSNVISIKTPHWDFLEEHSGGEILFGGIDHSLYKGDITYLPLTKESSDPVLNTMWTTNATSLRFTDSQYGHDIINEPLDDFSAVVNLGKSAIGIPGYVIVDLVTWFGAEQMPGYEGEFWMVDCTARSWGPTFTLLLGDKKFKLSPNQYLKPSEMWDGTLSCVIGFTAVENYFDDSTTTDGSPAVFPDKPAIVLGSWFMEHYYTVLDMDDWRVGFAKTKTH